MGAAEEKILVKKIEDMDRRGFPLRVSMVREMATKIIQQREGIVQVTLGKNWVSRLLEWYPHLASKFSTQVKKQRILNSDPKVLKHAFDVLATVIRNIQPHNIYNMDEKGLLMGKSPRVKVICVRGWEM